MHKLNKVEREAFENARNNKKKRREHTLSNGKDTKIELLHWKSVVEYNPFK